MLLAKLPIIDGPNFMVHKWGLKKQCPKAAPNRYTLAYLVIQNDNAHKRNTKDETKKAIQSARLLLSSAYTKIDDALRSSSSALQVEVATTNKNEMAREKTVTTSSN